MKVINENFPHAFQCRSKNMPQLGQATLQKLGGLLWPMGNILDGVDLASNWLYLKYYLLEDHSKSRALSEHLK